MSDDRTAAALLVGGSSSRMGQDKSRLTREPGTPPLYLEQIDKLRQLSSLPILLSVRSDQEFQDVPNDVELIPDPAPDMGPLGALAACLSHTSADQLLVLAVDLPDMSAAYLQMLIAEAQQTGKGIIPCADKRWEPLAAVYPRTLLELAQQHLEAGQLSMQTFIAEAEKQGLISSHNINFSERPLFTNLNSPDDLEAYRNLDLMPVDIHHWELIDDSKKGPSFTHIEKPDLAVVEEPVELRVEGRSVAVLMRTPGHDRELAAGFLFSENVIRHLDDVFEISECRNVQTDESEKGRVIDVLLTQGSSANIEDLSRHVFTSSSCGICGKAAIDSVFQSFPSLAEDNLNVSAETLLSLPSKLKEHQENFHQTGGLHASALFDLEGNLQIIREDVGRHNALDKIIGNALLEKSTPLSSSILLLSGRISFELMQKALAAGIPFVAGISAPSSLAIQFAQESGQTLVGFLRKGSFNVYAGEKRIYPDS